MNVSGAAGRFTPSLGRPHSPIGPKRERDRHDPYRRPSSAAGPPLRPDGRRHVLPNRVTGGAHDFRVETDLGTWRTTGRV